MTTRDKTVEELTAQATQDAQTIQRLTDEINNGRCAQHPEAVMVWACNDCEHTELDQLYAKIAELEQRLTQGDAAHTIGNPLTPSEQAVLDAFKEEMQTKVIPEIVAIVSERQQRAVETRDLPLAESNIARQTAETLLAAWQKRAYQSEREVMERDAALAQLRQELETIKSRPWRQRAVESLRHAGRCVTCGTWTCGLCGISSEDGSWTCEKCRGVGPYAEAIDDAISEATEVLVQERDEAQYQLAERDAALRALREQLEELRQGAEKIAQSDNEAHLRWLWQGKGIAYDTVLGAMNKLGLAGLTASRHE